MKISHRMNLCPEFADADSPTPLPVSPAFKVILCVRAIYNLSSGKLQARNSPESFSPFDEWRFLLCFIAWRNVSLLLDVGWDHEIIEKFFTFLLCKLFVVSWCKGLARGRDNVARLTFLTTSLRIAALSGLHAVISRLLICKNSPNCSIYSFSSSRRRFSLLHLLICDWGWKQTKEREKWKSIISVRDAGWGIERHKTKLRIYDYALDMTRTDVRLEAIEINLRDAHLIFRFSSYLFGSSWRTGHVRYHHIHYFRLVTLLLLLLWQ